MERFRYQFERLSLLLRTGIFLCTEEHVEEYRPGVVFNPIRDNRMFREKLIALTRNQKKPMLYQDSWQVAYAGIQKGNEVLLAGPFGFKNLNQVDVRRYYRDYGMHNGSASQIPVYSLALIMAAIEMLAKEFTGKEYTDEELLEANNMSRESGEQLEKEQILFDIREDEQERYHHTYQEERRLLECVREGKTEEAVRYSGDMDMGIGRLGHKDIIHWNNTVVAAVTLSVRAAIEGGLSPAEAYQISDFYIQKTEGCRTVADLLELRNRAVRDLTNRVRKKKESRKHSGYVDRCKEYISGHYKEKIYLQDIADSLGMSSTYLSRLFSRETGMRLQDYINSFRVERAANLLIYSEESISYIAEYVNFPSQSYFGKMFRRYKHMTPKEYRNRYKPAEFVTEATDGEKDAR